jgi:hypothetical protein
MQWGRKKRPLGFMKMEGILMQKKNYENSNISPCKKYNLQQNSSKRNQNPSRYHKSITNLESQHKPKYHLSKILILKKKKNLFGILPRGQNPRAHPI